MSEFLVLLYYHYAVITDTSSIVQHQQDLCESLQLKGRIRVANEGINGCLSGLADAIHQYINSFENDPEYAPLKAKGNVHWKIGYPNTTSNIPLERQQFDKLSVKVTKEVVSLNLSAEEMEVVKSVAPGIHLQPLDFHNMLRNESQDDIVVLDVRNVYETQIGHFDYYNSVGEVGSAIDPCTRSYSDFAEWCKRNKEVLKGDKTNAKPKKILMYCTGGVRCERASQYVKSVLLAEDEKSLAENVFQLYGGIQNYMDTLGEKGTLFRGKNFVYDNRIAVGSEVVGSCVVCAGSFDDYSYQTRCTKCRMLLLGNVTHSFTHTRIYSCLLYTSPSPRDRTRSRMPSSA